MMDSATHYQAIYIDEVIQKIEKLVRNRREDNRHGRKGI